MRTERFLAAVVVAVMAPLAAIGALAVDPANTAVAKRAGPVRISTKKLPGLGTVLVNGKGRTLYMFVPDKHSRVTCVRTCAARFETSRATMVKKISAATLAGSATVKV